MLDGRSSHQSFSADVSAKLKEIQSLLMNTSKATVELVADEKSFQWCYIEVERIVKNKS